MHSLLYHYMAFIYMLYIKLKTTLKLIIIIDIIYNIISFL